jgi:soluble lytic murein transglycosylase-like protein
MYLLFSALLAVTMITSQIGFSYSDNGLVSVGVDINDSGISINENTVSNRSLEFPTIKYNYIQYLPLNWNLMSSLGYKYTRVGDQRYIERVAPSETFMNDPADVPVTSTRAKAYALSNEQTLMYNGAPLNTQGYPIIIYNNMAYVPLTFHVKAALGLYVANDRITGLHMSTESEEALKAMIETSNGAYYEKMATFMTKINTRLSITKARDYAKWLRDACNRYGMDETWIMAVIWQESSYDTSCEYYGAVGLMQIMASTGRSLGLSVSELYNPQLSIEYGTKYLSQHVERYGSIERAIIAYNQGSYNVDRGTYTTKYLEGVKAKRVRLLDYLSVTP